MRKKNENSIIISLDFDGTMTTHDFPRIGKDIGAVPVLKKLIANGHRLILFTMRSDKQDVSSDDYNIHAQAGDYLTQAVKWFEKHKIPLFGINVNPEQHTWTSSPKAYSQIYVDDAALGCPLKFDKTISDRPFVDWQKVDQMFFLMGLYK